MTVVALPCGPSCLESIQARQISGSPPLTHSRLGMNGVGLAPIFIVLGT